MRIFNNVPSLDEIKTLKPELKALFWDMDGTLLNTETIHAEATLDVIQANQGVEKLRPEAILNFVLGQTDGEVYQCLSKDRLISQITFSEFVSQKDDLFFKLVQANKAKCLNPTIKELLENCKKKGIILSLVTSSEEKIAYSLINEFDLKKYFDHIITRQDTSRNKPDPAPYKLALKLAKVKKSEALIFEDSPIGLEAARASRVEFLQANWY